jgi:hypothetical protein
MKIRYLVLTLLAVAACSREAKQDDALTKDLALASQTQAPQPQFSDTANAGPKPQRMTDAPRTRPVQRPAQAGSARRENTEPATASARTIAPGAFFTMTSQQKVCTASNRPGDRFVAMLTQPVTGANGAVIPSGSSVVLEVASASPDMNSLTLRPVAVEVNGMSYPVTGDVVATTPLERTQVAGDNRAADAGKVAGGAVLGAIIGHAIGKSTKGTVIGAATGAAAGAVAAKASQKYEACLPSGAQIRLTLANQIVM